MFLGVLDLFLKFCVLRVDDVLVLLVQNVFLWQNQKHTVNMGNDVFSQKIENLKMRMCVWRWEYGPRKASQADGTTLEA